MPTDDLLGRLKLDHYPRSLGYDPRWVVENQMGPNPLWLMEALTNSLTLNAGARVLDLGAGTALTSIFLAKEFEVSVIAADLWVSLLRTSVASVMPELKISSCHFSWILTIYGSVTRPSMQS